MQLLTVSQLKTYRRCARLHHVEYELGYRPAAREGALVLGTAVHLGLEAWWNALKEAGRDPFEAAFAAVAGQLEDPFDQARLEEMLRGYHYRWIDAGLEPLAIEVEFRAPLRNPLTDGRSGVFELAGKLDVIVRDQRGRLLLVEHKSSGEDITIGSAYWKRLRIDSQVSVYFDGAAAIGFSVEACIYDVLGKPDLRPLQLPLVDEAGVKVVLDAGSGARVRTKDGKKWRETGDSAAGYVLQTRPETPDEFRARICEAIAKEPERYFARGEVVRLEQELVDHRLDVWQTARAIRDGQLAGRAPRNADACTSFGRTCALFDVCTGCASLDDTTRFVRLTNVHPELATEASASAAPPAAEGDAA